MANHITEEISSAFSFDLQHVSVLGSRMAYIDTGAPSASTTEEIAVFLHGNPTSSYLWRNILPCISPIARCIASDLIGMGKSDRVPGLAYRLADHMSYLFAFLKTILPHEKIILIVHDWGSAIGLNWALLHPNRFGGLGLMEFLTPIPSWEAFPERTREMFRTYRDPVQGRRLLIDENAFIKLVLPRGLVRQLTETEMSYYASPFLRPEDREPLFRFPNEVPIAGEPADVWEVAQAYHAWLLETEIPKIFFWGTPGAQIGEKRAEYYAAALKDVKTVHVGPGVHFLQEDNPPLIGREIAKWMREVLGGKV